MKKIRVDIAPRFGIKDRELYVEVRFDADNKLSIMEALGQHSLTSGKGLQIQSEALAECIQRNCQAVQDALKHEGVTGRWRANVSIMDRILEHYKNVNQIN